MAVNPTSVYQVYKTGSNTNGGAFDAGIGGAGTDYSQQAAAQLVVTDLVTNGTTTGTSATGGFTAAMVGNACWLSGAGVTTAGVYFITARASTNSITFDRAPGTGTGNRCAVGGAWADPVTNENATWMVPGVTGFIQGSGSRYPTTVDYTVGGYSAISGDTTNGRITWKGANGRPLISSSVGLTWYAMNYRRWEGIGFKAGAGTFSTTGIIGGGGAGNELYDCFFDQAGIDTILVGTTVAITRCYFFSSVAAISTRAQFAVDPSNGAGYGSSINDCLFSGLVGGAINKVRSVFIRDTIFSGNGAASLVCAETGAFHGATTRCTFDAGAGAAHISVTSSLSLMQETVEDNIFTNHPTAAIAYSGPASAAQAGRISQLVAGNTFYGNAAVSVGYTLPANGTNTTAINPAYTAAGSGNFLPTATSLAATVIPLATPSSGGTVTQAVPGPAQLASSGGGGGTNRYVYS